MDKHLTPRDREALSRLAHFLLPSLPGLPPSQPNLPDTIADFMATATPLMQSAFRAALTYLEFSPWLAGQTFNQLTPQDQVQFLERWSQTSSYPLRMLFKSLSLLVHAFYYAEPGVEQHLGFSPLLPPPAQESFFAFENGASLSHSVTAYADACIIGSGAGGAVVAKELSEQGYSVVLIEEGGRYNTSDFNMQTMDMLQTLYRDSGMTFSLGFPSILIPLGKCVGGTTVINSGSCFRLPEQVLWKWGRHDPALQGLRGETLEPYFRKVEGFLNVHCPPLELISPGNLRFKAGADSLGYSGGIIPRNIRSCTGTGFCCYGCPSGAKQSMQVSYIPAAVAGGTQLYTHCKAERILVDGSRATGVQAVFLDEKGHPRPFRLTVKARVTIVACGSIHTPALLHRSGLGLVSPALGRHLTLHPAAKATAYFPQEIQAHRGIPQGYYLDEFQDEGLLMEGIDMPPALSALSLPVFGPAHREFMARYPNLASFGLLLSDTSQGRVLPTPGRPTVWYSLNRADTATILKGLAYLADIFFEAGAQEVYLPISGYPRLQNRQAIKHLATAGIKASQLELSAFHPLGTCRMGGDPSRGAIDVHGQVFNCQGLYVCDGSIFPGSLGVNPQLSIMALATRLAEHLGQDVL